MPPTSGIDGAVGHPRIPGFPDGDGAAHTCVHVGRPGAGSAAGRRRARDGGSRRRRLHAAIELVDRVVPAGLTCWASLDPDTAVISSMTSGRARIPGEYEPLLATYEYDGAQPHTFAELARRPVPVARLSDLPRRGAGGTGDRGGRLGREAAGGHRGGRGVAVRTGRNRARTVRGLVRAVVVGARAAATGAFRARVRDAHGGWIVLHASRLVAGEGDGETVVTVDRASGPNCWACCSPPTA
jgi:hypothetical protein